jgi:Mn2+/Fe2+ NRAMP family transporter
MAAGTMGSGAAASLILAGAWFRYELLWVIPLMLPLFVISVDSASRIGLLNPGKGMFGHIREHIHPGLAWLIFVINIPVLFLTGMAQMSVMTSASMSLFGFYPPEAGASAEYVTRYGTAEMALSLLLAVVIIWLLTSGGYQRMQKVLSVLLVVMFCGFLVVALTSLQQIGAIIEGFVPRIPPDLPVPGTDTFRVSTISIIAIIGSAVAPVALLGIPYMSAENAGGVPDLARESRNAVINLGFIFGGYSIFVVMAGGFALYPQSNHAEIDTVHEAGQVLVNAFPAGLEFLGPLLFSAGLMIAALTTFVVVVQVTCYFWLDMFDRNWRDTVENKGFRRLLIPWVSAIAILAPFWSFPALLKVLVLTGFNTIVVPMTIVIVLVLVNKPELMGQHTASRKRNLVLLATLVLSVCLMLVKLPDYISILSS